jgi:hypothetical protein
MDDDSVSVTEVAFDEYETEIRAILEEDVTWLEGVVRDAVGPEYETDFAAIVERDLSKFRDPESNRVISRSLRWRGRLRRGNELRRGDEPR